MLAKLSMWYTVVQSISLYVHVFVLVLGYPHGALQPQTLRSLKCLFEAPGICEKISKKPLCSTTILVLLLCPTAASSRYAKSLCESPFPFHRRMSCACTFLAVIAFIQLIHHLPIYQLTPTTRLYNRLR